MIDTVTASQRQVKRQWIAFFVGLVILLTLTSIGALAFGSVRISPAELVAALTGRGTELHYRIIWYNRMPRVLAAVAAGGGLAIAGAVMQTVLRNPLGAPYTLGVSQAAAFGAALAILLTGVSTESTAGEFVVLSATPFAAFTTSLISTAVILMLVTYRHATPETMILTGVALGTLFNAGLTLLQYLASDTEVAAIVYWTFGDVGRANWLRVGVLIFVVLASILYFIRYGWDYDVLDAGTTTAKSLGIAVESLRIRGMAIASLVTALIVSFVGVIGFVGLVAPHIVRLAIGGTERYLIPASGLAGATLLVVADTAARTILAPVVLPVGILTSFIGAPLFIYFVVSGGEYW